MSERTTRPKGMIMDRVVLKELLSEMAEQLDAPDGPGGGAM